MAAASGQLPSRWRGLFNEEAAVLGTGNDLWVRAHAAHRLAEELQEVIDRARAIRRDAVQELVQAGEPQVRVARHIGLTAARVHQLMQQRPSADVEADAA